MKRWPDFFIAGAPKAGTTALHAALAGHPRLWLSLPKEPKYFLGDGAPPPRSEHRGPGDAHSRQEWVWRERDYLRLWQEAPDDAVLGESTPFYLADPAVRQSDWRTSRAAVWSGSSPDAHQVAAEAPRWASAEAQLLAWLARRQSRSPRGALRRRSPSNGRHQSRSLLRHPAAAAAHGAALGRESTRGLARAAICGCGRRLPTMRSSAKAHPSISRSAAHVRIARVAPEAKFVAMLRDPVDRAYSNWMHLWSDGLEPISDFVQAVEAEESRRADGWAPFWRYRALGAYGEQPSTCSGMWREPTRCRPTRSRRRRTYATLVPIGACARRVRAPRPASLVRTDAELALRASSAARAAMVTVLTIR